MILRRVVMSAPFCEASHGLEQAACRSSSVCCFSRQWPGASTRACPGRSRDRGTLALVEVALVIGGGALYWRAALETGARRRANLAGAAVIASGLITLGLNVIGD